MRQLLFFYRALWAAAPQFAKMMQELKPYVELWKESRKPELAAAAS